MDMPTIAFHVIMQDALSIAQEESKDLDNLNKLHFSLLQPLGNTVKYNCLPISHKSTFRSFGMIANIRPTPSSSCTQSNIPSRNSAQDKELIRTDCKNNRDSFIDKTNTMASDTPMRKLKKMGWYWGSISPEYASRLLENEQDGSFLIRDSSSDCYIFSMTFKLEGEIHHARIEHSKGHFTFGRSRKFFCTTIVDFIEQAIECSHNENLLFFLHRDPALEGPVRFRMKPLSRMKGLSSLKHMCRFAILPYVRKDKINELSIPDCLRSYLNEPFNHNPEPMVNR